MHRAGTLARSGEAGVAASVAMKSDTRILIAPDPALFCQADRVLIPAHRSMLDHLVGYMREISDAVDAVGLAAPQVGALVRVIIVSDGDLVMINPTWRASGGSVLTLIEHCYSLPKTGVRVERPQNITVDWIDLDGVKQSDFFSGFRSRVIQHECDHLAGITLFQQLTVTAQRAYLRRTRKDRRARGM